MNYLDELLGLYPGRDWTTRRYFLTNLSSVSPGLESDALLEFLWGEAASAHAQVRHMARRQLGRVLPACLRQAYGLEEAKLERDAQSKTGAAYVFTDPEGDVLIDLRKVNVESRTVVEVLLPRERLRGNSYTVRLRDTGAERAVTLVCGDTELAVGDSPPRKLAPTETVTLKAGR